ncbi:MAG: hypothetical protein H8E75_07660 [Puniceicoccaceae bacterium]|nr:hypothetical protein [Puniceicoccaceae bacterium]
MFPRSTDLTTRRAEEALHLDRVAGASEKLGRGIKPLLQILSFALTVTLSSVQSVAADTLESSNPFLPPGYGEAKPEPPKPVVQTNGPISREVEFRGIMNYGGAYQVSVFNKSENKSYWLYENRSEGGITVRGYDTDSKTITVNMNGRSERLTLMSATDAPLPVVSSVSQPGKASANNPVLPPGLENTNDNNDNNDRRRVIPRRRVILPKN